MINNFSEGGLLLPNPFRPIGLKNTLILTMAAAGKAYLIWNFNPMEAKLYCWEILIKKTQDLIKTPDPFVKEILEIWSDIFERES